MPISLTDSDVKTVTGTSATFDTTMVPGAQYVLASDVGAWFTIASSPTAVAATDGNHYIAPGTTRRIAAKGTANKVAIIRSAVDGSASLSLEQGVA